MVKAARKALQRRSHLTPDGPVMSVPTAGRTPQPYHHGWKVIRCRRARRERRLGGESRPDRVEGGDRCHSTVTRCRAVRTLDGRVSPRRDVIVEFVGAGGNGVYARRRGGCSKGQNDSQVGRQLDVAVGDMAVCKENQVAGV